MPGPADPNGPHAEPTLSMVAAIMDERDRLYRERVDMQDKAVQAALVAQEKAVQAALIAQDKLTNAAFTAVQIAVDKAESAQRAYNERSNEFRAALDDAQKLMLSRVKAGAEFQRLGERIEDIRRDETQYRNRIVIELTAIRDSFQTEMAAIRNTFQHDIGSLRETRSENEGRSRGVSATWAIVGTLIALGGVAVGIILHALAR